MIATKRAPASASPTASRTRSRKYRLSTSGSSVEPDLLDTKKSVRARSIARLGRAHLGRIGRVEHVQPRVAAVAPKVFASTSGARLDPPMPSSRMC